MKWNVFFSTMGFVFSFNCLAQTNKAYTLFFKPTYGANSLQISDSTHYVNQADSIQIEIFKFFISSIELIKSGKTVWKEKNSFHLLDATDPKSLSILLSMQGNIVFDSITFHLGIDSATNVSGAMGGDLDPTKGMYWAWQSGYVNFKLEGKSKKCQTRNHEFQFHLGGYQFPFCALQTLTFNPLNPNQMSSQIIIDIKKFLDGVNLSNVNHIMSPSKESVIFSEKAAHIFSIQE